MTGTDSASTSASDTYILTVTNTNDAPTVASALADASSAPYRSILRRGCFEACLGKRPLFGRRRSVFPGIALLALIALLTRLEDQGPIYNPIQEGLGQRQVALQDARTVAEPGLPSISRAH